MSRFQGLQPDQERVQRNQASLEVQQALGGIHAAQGHQGQSLEYPLQRWLLCLGRFRCLNEDQKEIRIHPPNLEVQ